MLPYCWCLFQRAVSKKIRSDRRQVMDIPDSVSSIPLPGSTYPDVNTMPNTVGSSSDSVATYEVDSMPVIAQDQTMETQTEPQEVDHNSSQTEGVESKHTDMQTERVEQTDSDMQTKVIDVQDSSMQTSVTGAEQSQKSVSEAESPQRTKQLQEGSMQTIAVDLCHSSMQTHTAALQHAEMQTPVLQLQHLAVQTAAKEITNSEMQTMPKESAVTEIQTEFVVVIVPEKADQCNQAGYWCPVDTLSQTDYSLANLQEGGCQTYTAATQDSDCQAVAVVEEQVTQTEVACAEAQIQTERSEQDAESQTFIPEPVIAESQTDQSMAYQAEEEVQATVDMVCGEAQATADSVGIDTQTMTSMAWQAEAESQVSVEQTEQDIQTDAMETKHCLIQTEVNTSQKLIQTEIEVQESECQTDIEVMTAEVPQEIVEVHVEEQPEMVQGHHAVPEMGENVISVPMADAEGNIMEAVTGEVVQTEVPAAVPEVAGNDIGPVLVASEANGSVTPGQTLSMQQLQQIVQFTKDIRDSECQTDPVTIIIGDASFLMKNLKNSSVAPSKVSGQGNEIQIELKSEEAEPTPYDLPDKENVTSPEPLRRQAVASPYRGRGVRTRGGGMYGRGAHQAVVSRGGQQIINSSTLYGQQANETGLDIDSVPTPLSDYPVVPVQGNSTGKFCCPVCSDRFHDSPSLYVHLQQSHRDAFNLIQKPKGREGKTITPRKPSPEPEPPILTPVEPILVSGPGVGQTVEIQLNPQVQGSGEEEAGDIMGVFEEANGAIWQQAGNKSKKRSLARRQITDEETAVLIQEEPTENIQVVVATEEEAERLIQASAPGSVVTTIAEGQAIAGLPGLGKRKHTEDTEQPEDAKRIRTNEAAPAEAIAAVEQVEPAPEVPEVQVTGATPKRRSRQPKAKPESVEVSTPQTRGRTPRSAKK